MNVKKTYVTPQDYAMQLFKYKKNVYSQNGEDGIIEHLIEKFNLIEDCFCCEFGAWDGKHLSNTFNLVENYGWKALMIEGDPKKYKDLIKTSRNFPTQIIPKCAMVHYLEGRGERLDDLLNNVKPPHNFDLLSIDVDGPDYHIWKSLERYEPKIVVIEHSGRADYIIQREGAIHKKEDDGSTSFEPMKELGESKGYELLVDTGNLIFVHKSYL